MFASDDLYAGGTGGGELGSAHVGHSCRGAYVIGCQQCMGGGGHGRPRGLRHGTQHAAALWPGCCLALPPHPAPPPGTAVVRGNITGMSHTNTMMLFAGHAESELEVCTVECTASVRNLFANNLKVLVPAKQSC